MKKNKNIRGACLAGFGTQLFIIITLLGFFDFLYDPTLIGFGFFDLLQSPYAMMMIILYFLGIVLLIIGARKTEGMIHGIVLTVSGLQLLLTYLVCLLAAFFNQWTLTGTGLLLLVGSTSLIFGCASISSYSRKQGLI